MPRRSICVWPAGRSCCRGEPGVHGIGGRRRDRRGHRRGVDCADRLRHRQCDRGLRQRRDRGALHGLSHPLAEGRGTRAEARCGAQQPRYWGVKREEDQSSPPGDGQGWSPAPAGAPPMFGAQEHADAAVHGALSEVDVRLSDVTGKDFRCRFSSARQTPCLASEEHLESLNARSRSRLSARRESAASASSATRPRPRAPTTATAGRPPPPPPRMSAASCRTPPGRPPARWRARGRHWSSRG
jgi:hypothetical protein